MQVLTVDYTAQDAPTRFCTSLKETGFAVLSQHPISKNLIDQVYMQWETFFNSHEKFNFIHTGSEQDGYFPFRTEHAKNVKASDLKEFYHFYPHGKVPPALKEISLQMYVALNTLGQALLQWVEKDLPDALKRALSMPLGDMITASPNTLLRILHYPPITQRYEEDAVRAAPHEDINFLTLLLAATTPGLQVQDRNGKWHDVACDHGNIVVNVGDMLQLCTQHYYISTTHQVINPDDDSMMQSRYSMPLFLHPRPDVKLSATHTAQMYLVERLKEIGIY